MSRPDLAELGAELAGVRAGAAPSGTSGRRVKFTSCRCDGESIYAEGNDRDVEPGDRLSIEANGSVVELVVVGLQMRMLSADTLPTWYAEDVGTFIGRHRASTLEEEHHG